MDSVIIIKHPNQPDNFTIESSVFGVLFISEGYWTILNGVFQIEKINGGQIYPFPFINVTVRDDSYGTTGIPYTYTNENELRNKLLSLGFLNDEHNDGSGVQNIIAGTNISVDNTDPQNPIVSATITPGSAIESVVAGTNVVVDNTDPLNPIVNVPDIGADSLQEMYDDDPERTTLTDGINKTYFTPASVATISDILASSAVIVYGSVDNSGATSTITSEPNGVGGIISHLDLKDENGLGALINSKGQLVLGVNSGGFALSTDISNLTASRSQQLANTDGTPAFSVSVGATEVTANAEGNIPIDTLIPDPATFVPYVGATMGIDLNGQGIGNVSQISAIDVAATNLLVSNINGKTATEYVQDAVGGAFNSTLVYDDAGNAFGRAAIVGDILISAGSNVANIGSGVIVNADINASAAISGTKLANTPAGNISATNVQDAINELDLEKESVLTFNTPLSRSTNTISIPAATNSVAGHLTASDHTSFAAKQDALVSGTNIKTVNSTTILGSGNLAVEPVLSGTGYVKKSGTTPSYVPVIPTTDGGTGLSTIGTALQLIRVNAAGTALEYYTPAYPKKSVTAGTNATGVTTEQLLQSIPITGGDFTAGNLMYILANFDRPVSAAGTTTIRFRVHTSAAIGGSVVGMFTTSTTSQAVTMERTLEFLPSNFIGAYPPTQAAVSDKVTPSNLVRVKNIALDPSTNWFVNITGQNTQNADSVNTSSWLIERK